MALASSEPPTSAAYLLSARVLGSLASLLALALAALSAVALSDVAHRDVVAGVWLLVAVVAPYKWHRYSWYSHGSLRVLPGFSLLFAGVVLLISMAVTEWQSSRRGRADSILTQKPLAIDDGQQDSRTPREDQSLPSRL